MRLTEEQRANLANQNRILAALAESSHEKELFEARAAVFERGYEYDYLNALGLEGPPVSEALSQEVHDILLMFRMLEPSIKKATGLSSEASDALRFRGFDGNDESEQYSYVLFYRETGRYAEIDTSELNSHLPMLPRYRSMLRAFRSIDRDSMRLEFTADELQLVADATKPGAVAAYR